jgi:hypothetical protein
MSFITIILESRWKFERHISREAKRKNFKDLNFKTGFLLKNSPSKFHFNEIPLNEFLMRSARKTNNFSYQNKPQPTHLNFYIIFKSQIVAYTFQLKRSVEEEKAVKL